MKILSRPRFIVLSISCYVFFALAWIFLSDHLLSSIVNHDTLVSLSTAKGIFFVLVSAAGFFLALRAVPTFNTSHSELGLNLLIRTSGRWRIMMYLFALIITLSTLYLHSKIAANFGNQSLIILLMLPIILSALIGGLGPGLLATACAAVGSDAIALPHLYAVDVAAYEQLKWLLLIVNGVAVSVFSAVLQRSLATLDHHRNLLKAIIQGTSDAIFIKNAQGRYLLANEAGAAFVNKSVEEVVGLYDIDFFDAESVQTLAQLDQAIMRQGVVQTHEERLTLQDGSEMTFLVTKGPVFDQYGKVQGLFGISRDITAQKNTELALIAREAALKQAQHLAHVGSWEWNLQTGQHDWSEEVYHIYGRDPRLLPAVYPEVQQYFTHQSWVLFSSAIEQALKQVQPYQCEAQVLRGDGVLRWISARGEPVCDEQGQLIAFHGTVQDITDQKLATQHLEESEERLRNIVNATSDGFWDWDLESGHVYRSPQYYELVGMHAEDDKGDFSFLQRLIFADDLPHVLQMIESYLVSDIPRLEFDFRLANFDSAKPRWVRGFGRSVRRNEQGFATRIVGTLSDITERKRVDDDFRFVLNEAGDAIWITDESGRYTFANPSACRLTGHSLEMLCAMQIPDLVADEHTEELPLHLERLQQQTFDCREWRLNRREGGVVSVELTTVRMHDGRYMAFGRDLTEKKRDEQLLKEREQQLERVLAGSDQGYWDWNLQTNQFQVSARYETMLGYAPSEMDVCIEKWPEIVHPDDFSAVSESIECHLGGESLSHTVEMRCKTKQGDWLWVLTSGRVVSWSEDGLPLMMSGTHTDISERKRHDLALRESGVVFDNSYEGIMVLGADQLIAKINPAFTRITGYSDIEAIGQSPHILSSGQHDAAFYQEMWHSVSTHDFWRGELCNRRKNGAIYIELLSISVVRDARFAIQYYIGIFSDITLLKAHAMELDRVAHYDALTGLPNRRLLSDRLTRSINRTARSGKLCAICFLDLDGFKTVNDQYGHAIGDLLLIGVAENLQAVLRADDTLARLGGDEFVLILSEVGSPAECTLILDRVLAAASAAVQIEGLSIRISASIGVSLYPEDNVDADTLLRHADQAMYLAKEAGKNRYQLFDPESDRQAQLHRKALEFMWLALERNEFVLHYQPKVDLENGEVVGAEALIRWQHPESGLLHPAEFLTHLYGSELEHALGEWVIHAALQQAAQWVRAGLQIKISVNVSANHLLRADFSEHLQAALARYPEVQRSNFELEVLETAAIGDMQQAVETLHRCKAMGVKFSLDDFGTGFSSLTYLRKLPIDTLKIDQSFVREMLTNPDDLGIVKSVIQLAAVFHRQVIAEGVETMAHGALLLELGCRFAQGYGIAKPMPAEDFPAWCIEWQTKAAWLQIVPCIVLD
ncbi:sensor domain-containing protein [Deefgea rivuli]|uniref:sensor domain-containing protein n=1 Tax=Deefgea rivuli TaxID=400948 RepID=UPI00068421ED|nr:PAS domain S-box protein [Deefgea rivuli]